MGKIYEDIDVTLQEWIEQQKMFFVGTAPTDLDAHLNLSPKGLDTFRVLDTHTVAYLDLTGSGIETVAHLRENGRITLMFCAFEGPPRILRLYGRGVVVTPDQTDFAALAARFPAVPGVRSVIRVPVTRIADSCGFGVPLMQYEGERTQLVASAQKKGLDGLKEYQQRKNLLSIDGIPGLGPED